MSVDLLSGLNNNIKNNDNINNNDNDNINNSNESVPSPQILCLDIPVLNMYLVLLCTYKQSGSFFLS